MNFFKMEIQTYLNLELITEIKFYLQYEPVLASKHVKTKIYGINTEQRFATLTRDHDKQTLTYKLIDSSVDSFEM